MEQESESRHNTRSSLLNRCFTAKNWHLHLISLRGFKKNVAWRPHGHSIINLYAVKPEPGSEQTRHGEGREGQTSIKCVQEEHEAGGALKNRSAGSFCALFFSTQSHNETDDIQKDSFKVRCTLHTVSHKGMKVYCLSCHCELHNAFPIFNHHNWVGGWHTVIRIFSIELTLEVRHLSSSVQRQDQFLTTQWFFRTVFLVAFRTNFMVLPCG